MGLLAEQLWYCYVLHCRLGGRCGHHDDEQGVVVDTTCSRWAVCMLQGRL